MNTEALIIAAIAASGGVIGGAGAAEMVKGVFGRKPRTAVAVENEVKLAQQAAEQAKNSAAYAQQMEESARNAWKHAHAAEERVTAISNETQARVDGLEDQVNKLHFRIDLVSRYLNWLLSKINDPHMTMEELREHVSRNRPPAGIVE